MKAKGSFRCTRSGVALVVVLAVLVILSGLLLSFFVAMQLDRQAAANSSHVIRAQELALGALEEVAGDLRREIQAGSESGADFEVRGVSVYVPVTNGAVSPARIGFGDADYGDGVGAGSLSPTLVRVSRASDSFYSSPPAFYDAQKLPPVRASAVPTSEASANGRRISAARWNKPLLMGTNVPATFTNRPPDWIYVTREGSRPLTNADLPASRAPQDPDGVLGRYAFVIYNEGALLDVNVAGAPASASNTPDFLGKSCAAYADLTRIPGLGSPDVVEELARWRDGASLAGLDHSSVVGRKLREGFLRAGAGDNAFFSRQDLVGYFMRNGLDPVALAFLGTFSRSINAPSWRPGQDSPNSSYAYRTAAERPESNNRNLANVRRVDGSPLLDRRFPLARISRIEQAASAIHAGGSGPSGALADEIAENFGLTWGGSGYSWTYDHGDAGRILTLNEVAALDPPRAPDFFELLKAAILNGSLGQHPGRRSADNLDPLGPSGYGFSLYFSHADSHIIQIGANIIDQFDANRYPTAISLPAAIPPAVEAHAPVESPAMVRMFQTYHGIENLPYLAKLSQITYLMRNPAPGLPGKYGGWLQPELWNPHRESPASLPGPSQFRVSAYGKGETCWYQTTEVFPGVPGQKKGKSPAFSYGAANPLSHVYFSVPAANGSRFTSRPESLTVQNVDVAATDPANLWQTGFQVNNRFAGICTGVGENMDADLSTQPIYGKSGSFDAILENFGLTVVTEYRDAHGWHPYGLMSRLQRFDRSTFLQNPAAATATPSTTSPTCFYVRVDPRTDRFSSAEFVTSANHWNATLEPSASLVNAVWKYYPQPVPGPGRPENPASLADFSYTFYGASPPQVRLSRLAVNDGALQSDAWYRDADGVARPGDGVRGSGEDGRLTFHGNTDHSRRPMVLDRPFRSVAELGYAFRDIPYKSLDFWSENSADAALLDVFCVDEEPGVMAGHVDLNAASLPVIEAILSGAGKKENDSSQILEDETENLAKAIAEERKAAPLFNRADLVTRLSAAVSDALPAASDRANKALAETSVRALAPVSNFRTWNLMIDLVAQSGRFFPTAQELKDFVVEGERRYWAHVAIDRYSGKVIECQIEEVHE